MKKRHNTFDYERNRKRVNRKKKKLPDIKCDQIKNAWDAKKSIKKNLRDMGLSTDPNKTIKLPRNVPKSALHSSSSIMEVDIEKTPVKKFVVDELETKSKQPHQKRMTMSDEEAGFCVYMMDKHGEDYAAMSRDRRNYYQETSGKIRKKIMRFKSIPDMYKLYADARTEFPTTVDDTSTSTNDDYDNDYCPATAADDDTTICPSADLLTTTLELEHRQWNLPSSPDRPEPFLGMDPHRCPTRLYDAGLRNGHFFSPTQSSPSKTTVFAPHATLCRVRKRLQFGRKAPKDRNGPDHESTLTTQQN